MLAHKKGEVKMKEYEVKYSESVEKTIKVKAEDEYTAKKVATKKYFEGLREDEVDVFVNGMSIDVLGEVGNHTIDVLLVRPYHAAKHIKIKNDLIDFQNMVGGNIEVSYPFEDEVCLIMDEEGKLKNSPLNRALFDEDGEIYDIIAGDFLVVGLGEEDFDSLSPELLKKYELRFKFPEIFLSQR